MVLDRVRKFQSEQYTNLKDGRFGPFLATGKVLEIGVACGRDLDRLFNATTGGSGGRNAADNLPAAHEGKGFATSSGGHLLSNCESTYRTRYTNKGD